MRRTGIFAFSVLMGAALLFAPAAVMAVEFQVPGTNTTLNIGGYVKLDIVYNDVSAGDDSQSNYQYAPGDVPLDGSGDEYSGELVMNARESRLWVKTSTPTKYGPLKTHLEGDFDTAESSQLVSNSRGFRIRHAYGSLNNWLFGTTWTLFMHLDSLPEINDFGGPAGAIFARQPQLRYTMKLGDNMNLAVSIENPETIAEDSGTTVVADDGVIPDVIARWSMNPSWGNVSAAAIIRDLNIEQGTIDDNELVFGVQGGAVIKFTPNDKLMTQISFGALGRYSGLLTHDDAVITAGDQVEGLDQIAGFVGYEHKWGGPWNCRSNVILGFSKADDPSELAGSDETEQTISLHVNSFVNPTPNTRLGVEFIRGEREVYDGREGDLNRFQFTARVVF